MKKGKTLIRLLILGGVAYALYKVQQEEDAAAFKETLREELGEPEEEPVCGMPNPVRELSFEEFNRSAGTDVDFEALDGTDPRTYCINADPVIYGIRLDDSDFFKYDLRFCEKGFDGDISGMHYDWTQQINYPASDPECTVYLNEDGQGVCRWEDGTRQYTLAMIEGASLVKLVWMRKKLVSLF